MADAKAPISAGPRNGALLDPVAAATASVLEEGLATYYQLMYIHREDPKYSTGDAKYDSASRCLKLMTACPEAVKSLRSQGKRISALTAGELRGACAELTHEEAMALARR